MVQAVEGLDHLLGLALAQEPVVDEHARELVAHCLVDEQRRDGRVDTAGERAENAFASHLGTDALDLLLDHSGGRPGRRSPRHVVEEVLEDRLPVRRVHDLGMELHAVELPSGVLECRHRRVLGRRHDPCPRRRLDDRVAVRHPRGLILGQGREERSLESSRIPTLPYSPAPVWSTRPPRSSASNCAP